MNTLYQYEDPLVTGTYVSRPNRFTIRVKLNGATRRVYLRNSGGLTTVLKPGRTVYCHPVSSQERQTDFDAVAVDVDGTLVMVDSLLPNNIVHACLEAGLLPSLREYQLETPEPALPDGGRADFLVSEPTGTTAYIEVKSNTHVVDGISKFPDRPTERGRRQLQSLIDLVQEPQTEAFVVFVVQRPDAECFRPFKSIDPEFATLLTRAADAGVHVLGLTTQFDPPDVYLNDTDLPIELDVLGEDH